MASKLKSFVVRRGNARFTEKAESFKKLIMELDAHQRLYPNATPVSFVREGDLRAEWRMSKAEREKVESSIGWHMDYDPQLVISFGDKEFTGGYTFDPIGPDTFPAEKILTDEERLQAYSDEIIDLKSYCDSLKAREAISKAQLSSYQNENKRLKRYINQLEKDQDVLKEDVKFLTSQFSTLSMKQLLKERKTT